MPTATFDVFLSYNATDKPLVEELARKLTAQSVSPWLDAWQLIPGTPWQDEIERALESSTSCAVLIGPSGTGPWQNEEMRVAIDRRVSRGGFRVIPVLLPGGERLERSRLPPFLTATTWVEFRRTLEDQEALHRLVCGIRGIAPGPGFENIVMDGRSPYRGLRVFDVEDAPFFFGREGLTDWLLHALTPHVDPNRENRFLAIVGASGSGKSSLARAGLLAGLKRGVLEGSSEWPRVVCKPGPDPAESLAVALADLPGVRGTVDSVDQLASSLRQRPQALHQTTRLAMRHAPQCRVVVLVDQFEELFTLCQDDSVRRAFIDNLLYAATVVEGQTIVVLTLRADFYGECAVFPQLNAALTDHQLLVGPMTKEELRCVIEPPAQLSGYEFEPGLAETLLNDVEDDPASLPLLEDALLELWDRARGRRRLLSADYEAIGRLEGALQQRADRVYAALSEHQRSICDRLFLQLTNVAQGGKDSKRRVPLPELIPAGSDDAAARSVLDTLAGPNARLVTIQRDEVRAVSFVEVAHEALIRKWSRLRELVDEHRMFRLGVQTKRRRDPHPHAVAGWRSARRGSSALLPQLDRARVATVSRKRAVPKNLSTPAVMSES